MTALTADRATPERAGDEFSYPVAASVICRAGGIAALNASGNVLPAITNTTLVCVGRFEETVDNLAGTAGVVSARVKRGVFRYANSGGGDAITAAEIGDVCYLVDDQTVAKTNGTSTRSAAGTVVAVDSAGVWVRMGI